MIKYATSAAAACLVLALLAGCAGDAEQQPPTTADTAAASPPATAAVDSTVLLDPNTASRDQLLTVSELNAAAADALIAGRPWADMLAVDAALAAQGLSEAQREAAYRRVWRRIDLNNASEAEILLIPNLGPRMAHEFEEYRPYEGMERFRREIGKYVNAAEVARLERYVEIR